MPDFSKLQMTSKASSNKVLRQGSGTFVVALLPGAGEVSTTEVIAHNFNSDNLIFQVSATTNVAGTGQQTTLPWGSPDGRVLIYAFLDDRNLYIVRLNNDSGGGGFPSTPVAYNYRLLIP